MSGEIYPDEAERALAEIERRHGQVVGLMAVPWWYWWVVAVLMVGLGAAVDSRRTAAIGAAVPIFVIGMLLATGQVVLAGRSRAQPRHDLVDPAGVLAILGLVAIVVGVSLATAFTLRTQSRAYPGTLGDLVGAVLLTAGGPFLNRYLRHRMLRNRAGRR